MPHSLTYGLCISGQFRFEDGEAWRLVGGPSGLGQSRVQLLDGVISRNDVGGATAFFQCPMRPLEF